MPTYAFKCPSCGTKFDRYLKLADYRAPQTCECGKIADKVITSTFVRVDVPAYSCPITNRRIEGRTEHEKNLRDHGCRILEPGETARAAAARRAEDEALENKIAESAAEFVATLPPKKQEQLAVELEHGADVEITRI